MLISGKSPQYFSFNPTQPITCAGKCDPTQTNPTLNPWMDPTHVHLWGGVQLGTGRRAVLYAIQ